MDQIAEGHIFISNWICKVIWIFAFWPATFTERKITSISTKLLWNTAEGREEGEFIDVIVWSLLDIEDYQLWGTVPQI